MLWFSQILIRHAEVRNEVSFNIADWYSVPPPATRSRADALALAERISHEVQQDPARFAELAREYSEDLPRRDEGGAMGGIQATQLVPWPHVLDALAALRPGQSSRVVETRYGFHIFYRSAPPPEERVSGAHIVIGHRDAQWLKMFARDRVPTRTRDEALALASDVYRRASAAPDRFARFADEFSEDRDAVIGGDFGSWSTREPNAFAPRMKRVRELRVGEVGLPIETHLGFEIIQRTPPRPRKQYRARLLAFPFSAVGSEGPSFDPAARAAALERAQSAINAVVQDPTRFDTMVSGAAPVQWEHGRGLPELSSALEQLLPGQVTTTPVETEYGMLVAQRLEPEPVTSPEWTTELPAPQQADLVQFIASVPVAELEAAIHSLAGRTAEELALKPEDARQLLTMHELSKQFDDSELLDVRINLFKSMLDGTRQLLGSDRYARYTRILNQVMIVALLGAPADSPAERGL